MRKILIITNCLPPVCGSGTYRTLKFIKYLPSLNWQPVVLTESERYYEKKDFTVVGEIPDCTMIFKTLIFRPFKTIFYLKKQIKSYFMPDKLPLSKEIEYKREKHKIRQLIVEYFSFLDNYLGWIPFALFKGLYIVRKYRIEYIYSTSPSPITHVIALLLNRITGISWVADFRDPWMFLKSKKGNNAKFLIKLEKKLEAKVVENSKKVICNTVKLQEKFREVYSNCEPNKFVYIPNGFDPDDYKKLEKKAILFQEFTITHTGEFYQEGRTPNRILKAASELIKEGKIGKDKIKFLLVGSGEYSESMEFKNFLKEEELEGVVELLFHVPHLVSIAYLFRSSLLLLLQPGKEFSMQVPAKAFEYAYVRKPIITVAPEGATSDFIKSMNAGVVVDPDDIDSMKKILMDFYEKHELRKLNKIPWNPKLNKFNRKNLTRNLVKLLVE